MVNLYERLEAVGTGIVILAGLILVFVPEPSTSVIGAVMVLVGIGMWLSKWRKMKKGPTAEERVSVTETPTQD